jgi:NAD(P)-dependent dehydrogenase (short-subunit alcohol dehydrogenase family)
VAAFADKVVLITGTARGCGAVLAEAFANAGATVVGCDRDADAGEAAAEKIRAAGGRIDFSPADVSREEDVEALVADTVDAHGRLSCAINNAGTEELGEIAEATERRPVPMSSARWPSGPVRQPPRSRPHTSSWFRSPRQWPT